MSEETREFLEAYKARRDLEEIIKRKDDDLKKKDERIAELEAIIAAADSTK